MIITIAILRMLIERAVSMRKVGIIGCGGIAQVHSWVLSNMDDVELVAMCDTNEQNASMLSEKYTKGKAGVLTDWYRLCESKVDTVHICTPHFLHAHMAIEMLKAGKTVFVEKPSAISKEQFELLKQEEAKHPGKLGFCFQNRYNETTLAIDQMISQGKIGAIMGGRAFVTWRRDEAYYADSVWRGKLSTEGGGVLINQSIHTLDLLLRYMGIPEHIEATIANHHLQSVIEVEDTVEAWLSFSEEKRACFYASNGYACDAPILLEIQGDKGRIFMNGEAVTLFQEEGETKHYVYEQLTGMGKGYWGCGHEACIHDFYNCQNEGMAFQNDLRGVENTFNTMMCIYETSRKAT